MPLFARRRNESFWNRLLHAFKPVSERGLIQSQEAFQLELAKEISRSNRREQQRDFSLIHLAISEREKKSLLTPSMLGSFQQRIRISDSLGWHSSNLAVLLPETDRVGAKLVADELVQLASRHGWDVDPAIYVYPWDDELISVSNEIALSKDDSDDEPPAPKGIEEDFERIDAYHTDHLQHDYDAEVGFNGNGSVSENGSANGNGFSSGAGGGTGLASVRFAEPLSATEQGMEYPPQATATMDPSAKVSPSRVSMKLSPAGEVRLNAVASTMEMVPGIPTPWWKRAIDVVGAGSGLILLSPLLLGAAVAIKVSSPGPVLFRQKREGKGGKQFDILKFRTMVVDAEAKQASLREVSEQDGPAFKLKNDPRITAVGAKLRKSCIDELPQLVNVLVGQMSLVGPRPLPVSESTECSTWQRMRLTVLPGLTCTWQAHGGRNVSFDQWMRMDLDYIRNRSFVSDVRLIIETAFLALLQRGSV